jgi:hypothetical protein
MIWSIMHTECLCNTGAGCGRSKDALTLPSTGVVLQQASLAHRQDMDAGACQPILVGYLFFWRSRKKTDTPPQRGA